MRLEHITLNIFCNGYMRVLNVTFYTFQRIIFTWTFLRLHSTVSQRLLNKQQEAQISPSYRAMRLVSSNLSCQLPRNSAETTYTTSPDQTDGMKLEV